MTHNELEQLLIQKKFCKKYMYKTVSYYFFNNIDVFLLDSDKNILYYRRPIYLKNGSIDVNIDNEHKYYYKELTFEQINNIINECIDTTTFLIEYQKRQLIIKKKQQINKDF